MKNKFDILEIRGEGAYGIVYKCRNRETNEYVAIKKFKEFNDEIVKKTMARELRVLQILKHENIVEYKHAFNKNHNLFLVFEYVEKNLLELLQENPKGLDPNLIKKIIYQLCKAVNYLHGKGIVHRDIKPENLLIDSSNKLKLCDFGFARTIKNIKENLTDYVATRWYRSPELLLTSGNYGPEVDNWSIGCIMGELTDGDPLFPGDNEFDQLVVIQKVIGRFTDEQYDLFSKNLHFLGHKLPEINRPETLERRYMGKLSKTAISFMKQLLHPDPKHRLKGEEMFKHAYFENYPNPFQDEREKEKEKIQKQGNIQRNISKEGVKEVNISNKEMNMMNIHPTVVNKSITINKDQQQSQLSNQTQQIQNKIHQLHINNPVTHNEKTTSKEKDEKQSIEKIKQQSNQSQQQVNMINQSQQAYVSNTTNINIINYNNYESKIEKFEKMEKEKNKKFTNTLNNFSLNEYNTSISNNLHQTIKGKNGKKENSTSQDSLIMTSSGFNKNSNKENILSLYGNNTGSSSNIDKNFKTFYPKGDMKYNYEIDYNFKKQEDKSNSKNKKQKNLMRNNDLKQIPEEGYSLNSNHNTNIGNYNSNINNSNQNLQYYNNNQNLKASPPKYSINLQSNFKTKTSFYKHNLQLPSISTTNKMQSIKNYYK